LLPFVRNHSADLGRIRQETRSALRALIWLEKKRTWEDWMLPNKVKAAVMTAPGRIEAQDFPYRALKSRGMPT
jgi:hypothetical protein